MNAALYRWTLTLILWLTHTDTVTWVRNRKLYTKESDTDEIKIIWRRPCQSLQTFTGSIWITQFDYLSCLDASFRYTFAGVCQWYSVCCIAVQILVVYSRAQTSWMLRVISPACTQVDLLDWFFCHLCPMKFYITNVALTTSFRHLAVNERREVSFVLI